MKKIVNLLAEGFTNTDIAMTIKIEVCTMKKTISTPTVLGKQYLWLEKEDNVTGVSSDNAGLKKNPLVSNRKIFQESGVGRTNRAARNNTLNELAKDI